MQEPGDIKEISIASPRICQTDLAGLIAGTSVINTLFHKYLPKNSISSKRINTVKNDTSANLPGEGSIDPWPSNVSVCEKAALMLFAITPPIICPIDIKYL